MSERELDLIGQVYEALEGDEALNRYGDRHEIDSLAILTVTDDERAAQITDWLAPRITGKVVVEIGAGIGLLALHMSTIAKRVFAIEAAPQWSWLFMKSFIDVKPKNLSYLFGAADEFAGLLKADIALFCSHSGQESMRFAGYQFAPQVIDVYEELLPPHVRAAALAHK